MCKRIQHVSVFTQDAHKAKLRIMVPSGISSCSLAQTEQCQVPLPGFVSSFWVPLSKSSEFRMGGGTDVKSLHRAVPQACLVAMAVGSLCAVLAQETGGTPLQDCYQEQVDFGWVDQPMKCLGVFSITRHPHAGLACGPEW